MSKRHRPRRAALGVVATGVVLVVVAAACGGSSAKAAAPTSTTVTGRAGFAAYRTCLSQHGVTLPQRTPGSGGPPSTGDGGAPASGGGGFGGGGFGGTPRSLPPGVTAAEFAAAQKACASKLPAGGSGGRFGGGAAFAAYASCLRDHGVTIASRPVGTPPTTLAGATRPTFNRNDPKFIAANKICQALLPSRTTTTTAG